MHSTGETVNMLSHLSFLIIPDLFAHYKKSMSLQVSGTLLLFLLHLVQKHANGLSCGTHSHDVFAAILGFCPWQLSVRDVSG